MDTVSIATSIAILISIVIIIAFQYYLNLFKKNKKILLLKTFAKEYQGNISDYELYNNLIIGIDRKNSFIFFINTRNNTQYAINLSILSKLKINHVTRKIDNKKTVELITDFVGLVAIPKNKEKPEVILEFYNSNYGIQLGNELIMAEKWEKIINNQLTK
ncbi:MAG: hypothetical protein GYA62_16695 [Bacteroidales bacterium]|nr:hypothetical protein [Bacteroidales bacterium]